MEKITDKIAALPPDGHYFSLEFFPPKTAMGSVNLQARLERMAQALRPLFVTVTWGAGGTTATKSLELAEICQRQLQLTTCLHLTCTNMNRKLIDEALEQAKALGIRNILALRGDPPRSGDYNVEGDDDSNTDFTWAIDLVRYIRRVHGDYFCIGVAAYPEGHPGESQTDVQDPEKDLPYLVEKVQAGADFIMTQLTYDIEAYKKFENRLRNHPSGAMKTMPIIPGLMPIQGYKILTRVTKLSGAHIPPPIMSRIEAVKTDDEQVKQVGVDIVSEIVDSIKDISCPGPRGYHFYTLNLEKAVSFILERCDLIPQSSEPDAADDEIAIEITAMNGTDGIKSAFSRRRASSINSGPHNRVIVDKLHVPTDQQSEHSSRKSITYETLASSAGVPALNPPPRSTQLQISEGIGSLGREATWDDFPNGRWGDARSPAFGEIDGYGPSLHVNATVAKQLWGFPVTNSDISTLFRKLVSGELYIIPWSEGGAAEDSNLNAETDTIKPQLLKIIDKNWWTLASQPAVNGVRSDDSVFGWGPPGEGFVFQKAFIEFFCPSSDYKNKVKPTLLKHGSDEFAWFATNATGDFESSFSISNTATPEATPNDQSTASDADEDYVELPENQGMAVTWGAFRGKEITTPTIIEEVSFRAWGEEAFRIWDEWRRIYPRGSATERFLAQTKSDVWLVCVIGQRFGAGTESGSAEEKAEMGMLWNVLASAE
ncbi:methylenetetrahydrofolate reductase [Talaromyces proteolyticus]|uniref:Methylenetetrahydrofolate reductase n=1 Tax=Talaromyces proteolyticus TaxID=1131652 RepID=A0AAD4KVR3_9EURO|nr:methylenetetrahydrofolate reductase [Talaromyces proteolyticus]KAH8702117.1 methylenetetrahydrofolate reductase [Talaromyces proteolyticus]